MDGSINHNESTKVSKRKTTNSSKKQGGNSNKTESLSSQQPLLVLNGTTDSQTDNKLISESPPLLISPGQQPQLVPASPKRILLLKKQLEKQEKNRQKNSAISGSTTCHSNGGHLPNGTTIGTTTVTNQVINLLASLNEEEESEILPTIAEVQQHNNFHIDQYPCTLLPASKFNPSNSSYKSCTTSIANSHTSNNSGQVMRARNGNNKNDRRSSPNNHERELQVDDNKITRKKQLILYFNSLRPKTFTPSLASVTLGAVLAFKATGNFDLVIFFMSCFTVLAVHGAGNLVNTYYDFVKGIDRSTQSVNQCPDRTLVDHRLSIDQVVHLGVIAYMFGCFGFVCLVFLSQARMEHLALVYFCGISCSFLYTGGLGLKYIGLGDILIMVIFGPISILFSFMSQSGYIDPATIAFALPLAFHTEAILHSNNTRDIESDQRAGAVTLAILIGPTFCHIIYALLLFIPYIMLIVSIIHYSIVFALPLVTITKAFQLEKHFRSGHLTDIPSATASLHLLFSCCYILSCFLIHPSNLPLLHVTMTS